MSEASAANLITFCHPGKALGILAVLTVSFVISEYYMLFQNAIPMNPRATGDFAYLKCISRESDGEVGKWSSLLVFSA